MKRKQNKQHVMKLLLAVLLIPCLTFFGTGWAFADNDFIGSAAVREAAGEETKEETAEEETKKETAEEETKKETAEEETKEEAVEEETKEEAVEEETKEEAVEEETKEEAVEEETKEETAGEVIEAASLMSMDAGTLSLVKPKMAFSVDTHIAEPILVGGQYAITIKVKNQGDWHRRKLENTTLKLYANGQNKPFYQESLGKVEVKTGDTWTKKINNLEALMPLSGDRVQVEARLEGDLYYTLVGISWSLLERNHQLAVNYSYTVKEEIVSLHAPHKGSSSETFKKEEGNGGLTAPVVWHFILNQADKATGALTLYATFKEAGLQTAEGQPTGQLKTQHFYIGTQDHDILIDAYVRTSEGNLRLSHVAISDPGNEDPGSEDPGNEDPGNEDPGNEDPGNEDPGNEDPGNEDPGNEDPGNEDPGNEDPGNEDPGNEDPGNEDPGSEDPGNEDPGNEDPGSEDPGNEDPGNEDPGNEDPGNEDPGNEDPGNEDPGSEDPGNEDPGSEDPGNEDPGNEDPGSENPGDGSSSGGSGGSRRRNTTGSGITEEVEPAAEEEVFTILEEPTPLAPANLEEPIPFAPANVETPSTLEAEKEDAVSVLVEDEEVPLAAALPKTGEIPPTLFYGIGAILTAIGAKLKRK
ncbi:hypothetical protein [Geosporobacter ferrireducens]|uniref:hypothetical protein n=1 Tax=Geosporobacter ferrireducens TaxID=1424294 RepID=UPI0023541F05|nr:hypothetical protein [Geosporobacter ferrireducens]